MTTTEPPGTTAIPGIPADPLEPVRTAILDAARRDAAAAIDAATAQGEQTRRRAQTEADRIREAARAQGRRDAEQVRLEQQARARRRARATVLHAQRAVLDEVTDAVHDRVRALWADEPTRQRIRHRLVEDARRTHGAGAEITDHPDGGIVVTVDDARATYLLHDLADRIIGSLGDELAGLWTP